LPHQLGASLDQALQRFALALEQRQPALSLRRICLTSCVGNSGVELVDQAPVDALVQAVQHLGELRDPLDECLHRGLDVGQHRAIFLR
jgi:hypothetical protein